MLNALLFLPARLVKRKKGFSLSEDLWVEYTILCGETFAAPINVSVCERLLSYVRELLVSVTIIFLPLYAQTLLAAE